MEKNDKNLVKILILLGLSALLLVCAVLEGYASNLTGYIIAFFAAVLAGCIVTAFTICTAHLIGLILFGFVIGFLTQAVGVTSDLWCYNGTFIFAAFSWAAAAVAMEGISRIIRYKLKSLTDHPLNVLMIVVLFGTLLVTLALQENWKYANYRPNPHEWTEWKKRQESGAQGTCFINQEMPKKGSEGFKSMLEQNEPFWIYYISLAGFAILMQAKIPFTELLSLILAAWIMGGISEWIGATANLWHFRTAAPPLFLVLGCWPLEFLVIRGLATRMKAQPSFNNR
jgi:hypothetical protein